MQLCQWASHVERAIQQVHVYFHRLGTRGGPSRRSMTHHAMGAEQCYAVQNALRWLSIRGTPSAYTWDQFLERDVFALADSSTLSFFVGQVSSTFVQKWVVPIGRTSVAMARFEPLIPGVLLTHFVDVEAGRPGFMEGMRGPDWRGHV